uniref:Uncharacterized protein n=1 Tax=Arundo donax TaxID=35708 RepID=A0A0A9G5B9_ARUDO
MIKVIMGKGTYNWEFIIEGGRDVQKPMNMLPYTLVNYALRPQFGSFLLLLSSISTKVAPFNLSDIFQVSN